MRTHRENNSNNRERGFSLIELLIVLVVVGVLVSVSVIGVQSTMRLRRVDTGAALVASKLTEARSNAIKRNKQIRLAIDTANRRLQVFDGTTAVGHPEYLPTGVTFTGTPPAQIAFDSVGRLTTASQTLTLSAQGAGVTKGVQVSPSGKVTLQSMAHIQ